MEKTLIFYSFPDTFSLVMFIGKISKDFNILVVSQFEYEKEST